MHRVLGNNPLLTYMIDDGTAEDSIGLTAGGTFVACNSFPVTGGNNVITSISIAWGTPLFPDPTLNGLSYTAVLWSDPNGDGSPTDAVVLAMAPGVISQQGTNTFITSNIPPTMVTTANFFVGFLITHNAGQFPAAFDEDPPTLPNRSWIDLTSNINDLSGSAPIESFGLVGNWLIRADGNTGGPTPTGTPSPTATATATPCTAQYTVDQIGGSIVPGDTDTGNHADDGTTPVTLPFSFTLYDQTFTAANVDSNGTFQFMTPSSIFTNTCLPDTSRTYLIFPYWDDLRTDANTGCASFPGGNCGVFTSISGTAPNRIFNIEWRAVYFATPTTTANFEVRLYEGQNRFDVVYGAVANGNTSATAGVQRNGAPDFTQYFCNGTGGAATGGQSYVLQPCGSPTPTPTASPSCTPAWQNEPAMVNARRNAATAVVGSNLYAITGFNAAPDYTNANESFNGTSWTAMAPIPTPHAQARAAVVGNKIYVPGGFNSVSFGGPLPFMQIYDTVADTWSAGMDMPASLGGVATAAFNGLVYVIAGYTNPFPTATNAVYIYDPVANSYTTGAPMPAPQGNVAGVLLNGEIYVVGGGQAPGAQYAYDPATNMWRTIAAIPTSDGTCQSDNGFVLDNELWIVGCLGLPINQQVWIYNPGSNMWRAGPQYNVDHQGPGAALFNTRGFVVGGGAAGGGSTAVESFGPCPGGSPTPTPTASPSCTPGTVVLQGSIDGGDPVHNSLNGALSSCAVSPACPGELIGDFHYDMYQLSNPSSSPVCITVTLSDPTCIYSEVYLGSFDPGNACTNYLADSDLNPSVLGNGARQRHHRCSGRRIPRRCRLPKLYRHGRRVGQLRVADADTNGNSDCDTNRYVYANSDGNRDSNGNSYVYADCNCNCHGNSDGNCDCGAAAYTDAPAASHAASTPISSSS